MAVTSVSAGNDLDHHGEGPAVGRQGGRELVDGDPKMVHALEHSGGFYAARRPVS